MSESLLKVYVVDSSLSKQSGSTLIYAVFTLCVKLSSLLFFNNGERRSCVWEDLKHVVLRRALVVANNLSKFIKQNDSS